MTILPFKPNCTRTNKSLFPYIIQTHRYPVALAKLIDTKLLAALYEVRSMSDLPALGEQILAGQVKGRVVIDVNR